VADILRIADLGKVQAARRKSGLAGSAVAVFAAAGGPAEEFVGDTHLHVVSLTGKDHQRFVLRLPAKAADGAIVAVMIEASATPNVARLGRLIF